MRFFFTCLILAAGSVAAILYLGNTAGWIKETPDNGGNSEKTEHNRRATDPPPEPGNGAPAVATPVRGVVDQKVRITEDVASGVAQPLILQDGRVLPLERREVPSERDGKLLLLATPVSDGEYVPPDKEEKLEVYVLGVPWKAGDEEMIKRVREYSNRKPAIREPFENPNARGKWYRLPRAGDTLAPGTSEVIRLQVRFRRLAEDDEVEAGQLIGLINPAVALEELRIKHSKIAAAAEEVKASSSLKAEAVRRERAMASSRQRVKGSVSDDDYYAAVVTIDRYVAEEAAKQAAVIQAQQELSGAWATLDLFFIKAPINGRIRTIYKQQGEAVKNLDAVLQLQNTRRLRVEAQVEVQDALPLQQRVRKAEQKRFEARGHEKTNRARAEELRAEADALTKVQAEITRPVPPKAVLSGHLQAVTSVAVTRGPLPRIVSAGEEGVVRIWERAPGDDRWHQRMRLDHRVPVRVVACSGKDAKKNYLVTATSLGRVRIFDLDNLNTASVPVLCGEDDEAARHQGAVYTLAMSPDGTRVASAGEDRAICLWDLQTGKLVGAKKRAAHNSQITSLAFTPAGQLVSASRDKTLKVWDWHDGKFEEADSLPGRSGEVATLGLDPTGEKILFDDEGRELRILSIAPKSRHRIEGTLINAGATGGFSTMALFSPDGRTILTNGNGPGRLQLWRAPSMTSTSATRAAELRQYLWTTGLVTCGAFDPAGGFAVTGTSDYRVLVWELPPKDESEKPSDAFLTYVEENLDTSLKRVTVRATIMNAPEGVHPGSNASIVVPPLAAGK